MVCHGPRHPLGKISVILVKAQKRNHRPEEVLDVLCLGLVTASGVGFLLLGETLRGSASRSARMRSMVAADVQMPLEKTFRPSFSATTQ
jgi:hypothetical protein